MTKIDYRFIAIITFLLCSTVLNAASDTPELVAPGFVTPFEQNHVLCQTELPNNGLSVVSMSNPHNLFRPFGTITIQGLSDAYAEEWSLSLQGPLYISDITADDDYVYVAGEAGGTGSIGIHPLDSGDTFIAWLGMDGSVLNLKKMAGVEGYYARLHLTPQGTMLYTVFDQLVTFGGSVLMELTLGGEVIQSRSIPSITVSDICTLPDGDIAIGGMFMRSDTIDGIVIRPDFGYVNYAARLSPSFEAQWFYLSEHVTFDDYHQIQPVGDNILFFAPERAGVSLVNPMLTLLNSKGDVVKQEVAKAKKYFHIVHMKVLGDFVVVASDFHNYANPNVRDTADLTVYDANLSAINSYTLIGEFQSAQTVVQPITVSGNENTVSVSWMSDSVSMVVDSELIQDQSQSSQHLFVTRFSLPTSTSIGQLHLDQRSLPVFPNPAAPQSTVAIQGLNSEYSEYTLVNTSGQVVARGTVQSAGECLLPNVPEGMYFLRVGERVQKILVAR